MRSPRSLWVLVAAYARTDRLDGGAHGRSPAETAAVVDACAGWKTIEIFVALLPVGWG